MTTPIHRSYDSSMRFHYRDYPESDPSPHHERTPLPVKRRLDFEDNELRYEDPHAKRVCREEPKRESAEARKTPNKEPVPPSRVFTSIGKTHSLPIKREYFFRIKEGSKTVEGRIDRGAIHHYRAGDRLQFINGPDAVMCTIAKIERFKDFPTLLEKTGFKNCIPQAKTLEDAVHVYHTIPNYYENARRFGVLAIHIQTVR